MSPADRSNAGVQRPHRRGPALHVHDPGPNPLAAPQPDSRFATSIRYASLVAPTSAATSRRNRSLISGSRTVGYNYVKISDTPGRRNPSRDYSRQYHTPPAASDRGPLAPTVTALARGRLRDPHVAALPGDYPPLSNAPVSAGNWPHCRLRLPGANFSVAKNT